MGVKCIAIGNRIMGDDSIGIRVVEELWDTIMNEDIEVIIAETDIEYALSKIDDSDFLLIIDSTYFDINPGTLTFTPINDLVFNYKTGFSQHQPSLLYLIKQYNKNVDGFVIGIEIEKIEFNLELSNTLNEKFSNICEETLQFIKNNKTIKNKGE